ncbi:alpha/beta hydrolase [Chloroflexia bacterium SDU3-3]|nr:alpha/beta hydrolase [Chloroflexia bacterium SDU3-3]
MPSRESVQIRSALLAEKNAPFAELSLAERRAGFEGMVERHVGQPIPLPEGTHVQPVDAGGIPAEWVVPPHHSAESVLLYLHGGGYILGSPRSHRDLVARLSLAAGVRSLLIDYRLAPEHPFPAAVEDALAAYRWLLGAGVRPEQIVVGGDSAGGGLSLALLLALRQEGLPMPAGAALISPWTDLPGELPSRAAKGDADPIFTSEALEGLGKAYPGATDPRHPQISPIHADLRGLPALAIQVGEDELLLDDSLVLAEHARAADLAVELSVWPDMWHVFQIYAAAVPEAQRAIEELASFIRRRLGLGEAVVG